MNIWDVDSSNDNSQPARSTGLVYADSIPS